MGAKWNELKRALFAHYPVCKLCHRRAAVHLHHAVINKGKVRNKKFHKYLDVKENALEVCEECHKTADGWRTRVKAYNLNAKRYGREHMKDWYENLPFAIKEKMP